MAVADAVCRLVPGVLSDPSCYENESHWDGLLEYPQYSRPEVWHDMAVPKELLTGDHSQVERWRRKQQLKRTWERRPDMFARLDLSSKEDQKLLAELERDRTPSCPHRPPAVPSLLLCPHRPMGLTEYAGLTAEEIRQAFDQVMDFCLGLRPDFAAGVLPWSQSGADHFADVRRLFLLDLWVLGLSLVGLLCLLVYSRFKRVRPYCFRGRGPGFWAAAGLAVVFLTVGGLAALDFDRAFVIFHALFFPGKTNCCSTIGGPVILILPEEFFRNCALLILALLMLWCAVLIFADLWAGKRRKQRGLDR